MPVMSANGPKRRFAAVQHDACNGRRSGLSLEVAGTAVSDPLRKLHLLGATPNILADVGKATTQSEIGIRIGAAQ
jgi:hypothetical protein